MDKIKTFWIAKFVELKSLRIQKNFLIFQKFLKKIIFEWKILNPKGFELKCFWIMKIINKKNCINTKIIRNQFC